MEDDRDDSALSNFLRMVSRRFFRDQLLLVLEKHCEYVCKAHNSRERI